MNGGNKGITEKKEELEKYIEEKESYCQACLTGDMQKQRRYLIGLIITAVVCTAIAFVSIIIAVPIAFIFGAIFLCGYLNERSERQKKVNDARKKIEEARAELREIEEKIDKIEEKYQALLAGEHTPLVRELEKEDGYKFSIQYLYKLKLLSIFLKERGMSPLTKEEIRLGKEKIYDKYSGYDADKEEYI